jgi:hypothetical protein
MKFKTEKLFFLLAFLAYFTAAVQAQVTIGAGIEPHKDALLDLKEEPDGSSGKGMLLPRVSLKATDNRFPMTETDLTLLKGMTVYNLATHGTGATAVTPGAYYHDGAKWVRIGQQAKAGEWFYMPAFNLPIPAAPASGLSINLYDEYKKQFTKAGNTQFVSSNASATTVTPLVYAAGELDFFVTAYPPSVLKINSISAAGVMNYDVLSTNVPEDSFINIIFVVK